MKAPGNRGKKKQRTQAAEMSTARKRQEPERHGGGGRSWTQPSVHWPHPGAQLMLGWALHVCLPEARGHPKAHTRPQNGHHGFVYSDLTNSLSFSLSLSLQLLDVGHITQPINTFLFNWNYPHA